MPTEEISQKPDSESRHCSECGAPIRHTDRPAFCSVCLLSLALGNELPPIAETQPFGDYDLIRQIGQGGMGIVYEAVQSRLNRRVALKMIRTGRLESPKAVPRFQIEARAAARLDHPNIVPIYDVGEHEGQCFFSMKLIEGKSLGKLMSSFALPLYASTGAPRQATGAARHAAELRIAELIGTIARAVHYAHGQGIVHRDVKPNNILIDRDERPYLTDFGIAKVLAGDQSLTSTADVLGTPSYMSPEQSRGRPVTPAADIYSLGSVFYELLTGRPPFRAETPLETLRCVAEEDPAPVSTLNPHADRDLRIMCAKCLEKEPLSRYASAEELADDLERWTRREPIRARPIGRLARVTRWVRRNPVGTALIGSLCIGLCASLALLNVVREQRNHQAELAQELQSANQEIHGLLGRAVRLVREYLEGMWANDDRRSVEVSSDEIATLASLPTVHGGNSAGVAHYRLALLAEEHPVMRARQHAHLIAHLERQVSARLHRPVRFDLKLYKFINDYRTDLIAGRVDFARLGILPFLQASKENRELQPLLVPRHLPKRVILFTRPDTGIRSLADLRGHSVAFGDTNSSVSFRAQIELARAGIGGTNLAQFEFLDATLDFVDEVKEIGIDQALRRIGYLHSHAQVIEGVASGRYDAGVAVARAFELHCNRGLIAIPGGEFTKCPVVWAARADLPGEVCRAIQEAMTDLKQEPWLPFLPDSPSGFERYRPELYATEIQSFDRIRELFPPKPSPARLPVPLDPSQVELP